MNVLIAGLAGGIVLFRVDGLLLRLPYVVVTKEEFEGTEGAKRWGRESRPLFQKILVFLAEGFLFAFAFAIMRNGLPDNAVLAALLFWFVILALRIIPEAGEFWLETDYPLPLILLEAGMDVVTGLAAAFTYALIIS